MRRHAGSLLALWFLLVLSVDRASAALPGVYVDARACPELAGEALRVALRVELAERLRAAPDPASLRVRVRCTDTRALLEAPGVDSVTAELRDAAVDVRPRVLALAVAELVRDLDALPAPLLPPSARPLPPASAHGEGLRLGAAALLTTFRLETPLLLGASLTLERPFGALVPGLELGYLTGTRDTASGEVRASLALVTPHLALVRARGAIEGSLGLGFALGFARVAGQAHEAGTHAAAVSGLWASPVLDAVFAYRLGPRLRLSLRGAFGVTVRPVTGAIEGARDLALAGPWASLALGASLAR